jgi:enterochelin esterase-like enzyme
MSHGLWRDTTLAGHLLDVFEPARPHPQGYAVIYLHGVHLARLVDNRVYAELFDRHGLRVVAPMTRRSWWTDRICREFDPALTAERHVRQNVLGWLAAQYGIRPPRVGLLGTSMGGQGALRIAFKYPQWFPIAAALAPAIDYHLRFREGDETLGEMYADEEQARQDTATLHVHPLNWPKHIWFCSDPLDHRWHDSAQKLHMKLSSLGIPHQCDLETRSGGHGWDYYNALAPAAIDFIVQRLDQESRSAVA